MRRIRGLRQILLLVCLIMLGLGWFIPTSAQKQSWSPENREINISYPDSSIRAYVLIQTTEIKTFDDLSYYWIDQDKLNVNRGGYSGVLLDGAYQVYDWQKNLITQGTFQKGLMHGTWKFWDKNGYLLRTIDYVSGQIHGELKIYDTMGEVRRVRKFKKGIEKISNKELKKKKNNLDKPNSPEPE